MVTACLLSDNSGAAAFTNTLLTREIAGGPDDGAPGIGSDLRILLSLQYSPNSTMFAAENNGIDMSMMKIFRILQRS